MNVISFFSETRGISSQRFEAVQGWFRNPQSHWSRGLWRSMCRENAKNRKSLRFEDLEQVGNAQKGWNSLFSRGARCTCLWRQTLDHQFTLCLPGWNQSRKYLSYVQLEHCLKDFLSKARVFYHSDFTWNQFLENLEVLKLSFLPFKDSEFWQFVAF